MEQNSRTVASLSASVATAAMTSRWNSDSDYTSPLGDIIRTSPPQRPRAHQLVSHHRRLLNRHTETTSPPSTQTHRNNITTAFYTYTQKQHRRLLHRHTEIFTSAVFYTDTQKQHHRRLLYRHTETSYRLLHRHTETTLRECHLLIQLSICNQ